MISSFLRFSVWDSAALAVLLALGLYLRLDGIHLDLVDHHCFRQGTEAMMARHFHREGIFLQYPHINGYGPGPVIFVNECPLYPATVAVLYRMFGEKIIVARLLTVFFSLGTAALCYLTLRKFTSNSAPFWGTLLFVVSPLGSYVGRCVLRHPMGFFLMALGFFFWIVWIERPRWWSWFGACAATAGSILVNYANAYIGLPMLAALLLLKGPKALLDRRIWLLAGLALLPSILWLKHAIEFGAWFLTGIEGDAIRGAGPFLQLKWIEPKFFESLGFHLWRMLLTPAGCILTAAGLILFFQDRFSWIVRSWVLAVFLYFGFDHYAVTTLIHDYYFVHALFPACLAFGIACGALIDMAAVFLPRWRMQAAAGTALLLLVLTLWSWKRWDEPLREDFLHTEVGWLQHWIIAGEAVRTKTEPDAQMIVDRNVDSLIYLCDRPGWLCEWPTLTEETLRKLIDQGADYLLLTTYTMSGPDQFSGFVFDDPTQGAPGATWVRANCPVVHNGRVYEIIDLSPLKSEAARE